MAQKSVITIHGKVRMDLPGGPIEQNKVLCGLSLEYVRKYSLNEFRFCRVYGPKIEKFLGKELPNLHRFSVYISMGNAYVLSLLEEDRLIGGRDLNELEQKLLEHCPPFLLDIDRVTQKTTFSSKADDALYDLIP